MNKEKSLLFSIITILVIGLVIAGGTFAYFQWTSGAESGTKVNVTIEMGGITMHIEPEETEFVGLYPTDINSSADCGRTRYGDALVTIVNNTGTLAIPSFKLKVRVTKGGTGELTQSDLNHIRYSVVPLVTTKDVQGNPIKGVPLDGADCFMGPSGDNYNTQGKLFNNGDGGWAATGLTFISAATDGSWSHIPQTGDAIEHYGVITTSPAYLPRQYYIENDVNDMGKAFSQGRCKRNNI